MKIKDEADEILRMRGIASGSEGVNIRTISMGDNLLILSLWISLQITESGSSGQIFFTYVLHESSS